MSNHGILEQELIHSDTPNLEERLEDRVADLPATKPEFYLTMLEPSGTEKKRRAASASISLFLQCVGSLLVIPLMITDTLPTRQLVTFLVAPPPPPAAPAAALKRAAVTSNVSGHPLLVQSATNTVAQWKYRPYLINGEPVEVETTITVNFKLNG